MTVADRWRTAQRTVLVVNSDVPASLAVARWYCAQRGIPETNIVQVPLGTRADYSAFTADRFTNFWYPIADKVYQVNAEHIAAVAGCPAWLTVQNQLTGANTALLSLTAALSLVKRVLADGVAARAYDTSGAGTWQPYKGSSTIGTTTGAYLAGREILTRVGTQGEQFLHPRFEEAKLASGQSYAGGTAPYFYRPSPLFTESYSQFQELPSGWVGLMSEPGPNGNAASHPAGLEDDSKHIINRALRGERSLEEWKATATIVVAIYALTSRDGFSPAARQALIVDEFVRAGFQDVRYFYYNGQDDGAATYLAPPAGAFTTLAELDANTTEPVEYDLLIGPGLRNGAWLPTSSASPFQPSWRPSNVPIFVPKLGAISFAGLSEDRFWTKACQIDGLGVGGRGSWTHQNTFNARWLWEMAWALMHGRSLAEACFWDGGTLGYWSGLGDPLYRPMRT